MAKEFDTEWKERVVTGNMGTGGPLMNNTQIKISEEGLGRWIA
jgi:hypothetical protein